jgi:hypothetical protein
MNCLLCRALCKLLRCRHHRRAVAAFTVNLYGGQPMSAIKITIGGNGASAVIDPATVVDAAGAPDKFLSPPVWTSDNPAVATVTAAADGMSAQINDVSIGVANIIATYTNPDGKAASSSNEVDVVAVPVDDVAALV